MKIGIIGAGISGLVLANTLKHLGIRFKIFEQDDSLNKNHKAVVLAPNASKILAHLDLLKLIIPLAHEIQIEEFANEKLETFFKIEPKKLLKNNFNSFLSVSDLNLKSILLKNLSHQEIYFSHNATDVSQRVDKVMIKFSNGESEEFDYVVAADGYQSKIRLMLFPYLVAETSGETNITITVPIDQFPMSSSLSMHLFGHKKQFLIHALPNRSWTCQFIIPHLDSKLMHEDDIKKMLLLNFHSFNENVLNLIKNHNFQSCVVENLYGMFTPIANAQARIFFIGDSAHIISPIFHQDIALAMEDAWMVGLHLNNIIQKKENLRDFNQERKKRIQFVVQTSSIIEDLTSFQERNVTRVGQGLLKRMPQFLFDQILKKLYTTK